MRGLRAAMMATALLASAVWAGKADAAATFTFVEQGGDVVGTLSGSLDLTGLSSISANTNGASISSSLAFLVSAPDPFAATSGYDVAGPLAFGPGASNVLASSRSGLALNLFGGLISGGLLYIDASYVSGAAMAGGMTFAGTDLAGLDVTAGSYTYTLRNQDTFTVVFREAAAVPAPASLPVLGAALAMLGFVAGARRKG